MEDDAVSSVVATVILVALVVIIAGMIAALSLGYGVEDSKSVGLQVISQYRDAIVTLFTGADVSGLEELKVSVSGGNTVTLNESGVQVIGMPLLFKNVAGVMKGSRFTTVTGVFNDHVTKVLWSGNLFYESQQFTLSVTTGSGESFLKIMFPSDWTVSDVLNMQAGYGRQIIVEITDSSGQIKLQKVTGNSISSLAALGTAVNTHIPYSENLAGLSPGEYTVNLYSQKVDITDLTASVLPTIGEKVLQTSQKIRI